MYIYITEFIINIVLTVIVLTIFFLGVGYGRYLQKKENKPVQVNLKYGSVEEIEQVNEIINEIIEKKKKELREAADL